jgi:phospholipid/cholesterol/gamma-HCH transport system substrate-binding protein
MASELPLSEPQQHADSRVGTFFPYTPAMAPDKTSWRSLIPGLIAVIVIVLSTIALLMFAQVGALHGDTARVFAATDQARGLLKGSDVWLAGQKVGVVADIRFQPVSVEPSQRLIIELELLKEYLPQLRGDSYAQIRTGGSLIGAQVLYLTTGTPTAAAVDEGDTLRAKPQGDTENVASQIANASRQFPAIINNVKLLSSQMESARGTLGAFGAEEGVQKIGRVGERAADLTGRAFGGDGTIGLILRRNDPLVRAKSAMARADSVRVLLGSSATTYGRMRKDSTLIREIGSIRNEVSIVKALLAEPHGTLGRVRADSAIVRQLGLVEREFTALKRDIIRDPLRFISF